MTDTQPSTQVGVFTDPRRAQAAVAELKRSGFVDEQIGLVGHAEPSTSSTAEQVTDKRISEGTATGAAVGASLGALWGIGIAAGLFPAVGAVFVGGTLMALLASAGGGAVLGSLIGALIAVGVPQDEAAYYEQEFRRGKILVTVQSTGRSALAHEILQRHGAYDHASSAGTSAGSAAAITPPKPGV